MIMIESPEQNRQTMLERSMAAHTETSHFIFIASPFLIQAAVVWLHTGGGVTHTCMTKHRKLHAKGCTMFRTFAQGELTSWSKCGYEKGEFQHGAARAMTFPQARSFF
jgi:hypothetical protein